MKKIAKLFIVGIMALSFTGLTNAQTMDRASMLKLIEVLKSQLVVLQAKLAAMKAVEAQNEPKNPYVVFYINDQYVEEKDGYAAKVGKSGNNDLKVYLKDAELDKTTCSIEMPDKPKLVLRPKNFKIMEIPVARGYTSINITCIDDKGRNAEGKFRSNLM